MIQSRLMQILRSPIITEKSQRVMEENNTVTFKVLKDASKPEIKAAVESLFNVKVVAVNTLNMKGKKRRSAHGIGVRSDWKKAYVTLAQGQSIDLDAQSADKESN